MARYYFDLQDYRDPVGADLPDEISARHYAMRLAGDLLRDTRSPPDRRHYWRMDIREGKSRNVASLVLELLPAQPPSEVHVAVEDLQNAAHG